MARSIYGWSSGDFWWKAFIVFMGVYALILLYTLGQQLSGKKCLQWSKRYRPLTQQWVDAFPCMDWED
jgi:hypothetical protein